MSGRIRRFLDGLLIGVGVVCAVMFLIGLSAYSTHYTPPNSTDGILTQEDYNNDWSSLGAFLNGKISNVNISTSDKISASKIDFTGSPITDADIESISVSKIDMLKAHATSPASSSINISAGWYITADGKNIKSWSASSQAIGPFTPTGGTNRYDLVYMDSDATAHVVKGVEEASPTAPYVPGDGIPIALVSVHTSGSVTVTDADITDARPLISLPRAGPGLRVSGSAGFGVSGRKIRVSKGSFMKSDGSGIATLANDTDVTIDAIVTGGAKRIDVVSIRDDGTIFTTKGAEGSTPSPPAYPPSGLPLAEVYVRDGSTSVADYEADSVQSYIRTDARPVMRAGASTMGGAMLLSEDFNYDSTGDGTLEEPGAKLGLVGYQGCVDPGRTYDSNCDITIDQTNGTVLRLRDDLASDKYTSMYGKRNAGLNYGGVAFEARVKIEYHTTVTNSAWYWGLAWKKLDTSVGENALTFRSNDTTGAQINIGSCASSTCTVQTAVQPTQSPTFSTKGWHVYRVEATKTQAIFYVDGSPVGTTITTNLPSGSGVFIHPYFAASRLKVEVDYIRFYKTDDGMSCQAATESCYGNSDCCSGTCNAGVCG